MTAEVRLMTLCACLFVLFSFSSPAFSASPDNLQVMKISPQDRTAVVRGNDGKMKLVREGEVISDQRKQANNAKTLTVIEIAEGRIVFEEQQGDEKETVIIRLKDGKQMVERIRKTPPAGKPMQKPAFSTQQSVTGKDNRKSSIN